MKIKDLAIKSSSILFRTFPLAGMQGIPLTSRQDAPAATVIGRGSTDANA
jgi:hypothetical protein